VRGRSDGAANDEVVGAIRDMRDEAARESRILDALDEAIESWTPRRFLSPFQGFSNMV
jgi:hypothetical protein